MRRGCSGSVALEPSKKKQWAQLGFDSHGLRLQLHFLRAEAGGGYHLIHCRATPPPLQSLALSFTFGDGQPCEVVAEGRGVRPQTPFKLVGGDMSVRVPRQCRVAARLTAGGEEWRLEEVCRPEIRARYGGYMGRYSRPSRSRSSPTRTVALPPTLTLPPTLPLTLTLTLTLTPTLTRWRCSRTLTLTLPPALTLTLPPPLTLTLPLTRWRSS